MAKKNNPVAKARTRKVAPVKKPFPVGFAIASLVLVVFLGSIITYSARNQGLGDTSSLKYAQSQVDDLTTYKDLKRDHKQFALSHPDDDQVPPTGGEHNATPQSCQVYDKAIANEHAIHSLEHGAVWITYNGDLSKAEIDKLKKVVEGDPSRMLSPYPGLKSPISVQAWGQQIFATKTDDKRIKEFAELFTGGPQAPERNATCVGTTETGPLKVAPAPAPSAAPTAAPAPTASK